MQDTVLNPRAIWCFVLLDVILQIHKKVTKMQMMGIWSKKQEEVCWIRVAINRQGKKSFNNSILLEKKKIILANLHAKSLQHTPRII